MLPLPRLCERLSLSGARGCGEKKRKTRMEFDDRHVRYRKMAPFGGHRRMKFASVFHTREKSFQTPFFAFTPLSLRRHIVQGGEKRKEITAAKIRHIRATERRGGGGGDIAECEVTYELGRKKEGKEKAEKPSLSRKVPLLQESWTTVAGGVGFPWRHPLPPFSPSSLWEMGAGHAITVAFAACISEQSWPFVEEREA